MNILSRTQATEAIQAMRAMPSVSSFRLSFDEEGKNKLTVICEAEPNPRLRALRIVDGKMVQRLFFDNIDHFAAFYGV